MASQGHNELINKSNVKHWTTLSWVLVLKYRWVPLPFTNVLSSYDDQYTAPNSKCNGGEHPHPPTPHHHHHHHSQTPTNGVEWPLPLQIQVRSLLPLKCELWSFTGQDNLSCESKLKWFKDGLCIYSGSCIYSGGETRHSWNLDF